MAHTVILGSGVIGLSTAFYLRQHQPGTTIHLVDSAQELFSSASGYAGGFLAKDWFRPNLVPLAELSFEEHKKLAEDENGRERWADPLLFCKFLLEKVKAAGVRIHNPAAALRLETDINGKLSGVVIKNTETSEETLIPAIKVLLAAGSWTPQVFNTLFKDRFSIDIPIGGLGGHSLVLKAPSKVTTCHSVYTTMDAHSPEIYSRPNGEIYVAGVNSPGLAVPEPALKAATMSQPLEKLKDIARRLIVTPSGEDLEIVREGLCFRPVTVRGTPYIARLTDEKLAEDTSLKEGEEGGVFIAAGHGPWGISLSLGTGKVVAEMLSGKPLSVDISSLGF
ncbi:hypothetical protein TGAM01_v209709 [Trichoderma gamsii]|uniref:FAD dependent oxidoreductase domain-containing protein n=1 Tax=Trichoderma gamsii TaxID=398673 RepID=A0A2P4ZAR5_9HYPO|nr:hypothetical protein TGAM01_v209709 [Trichoderma gamsii]PON21408.1 hypothetical protein TGAM01_v209709 [Trichoderma gamsii]